jgi:hypothetical protein
MDAPATQSDRHADLVDDAVQLSPEQDVRLDSEAGSENVESSDEDEDAPLGVEQDIGSEEPVQHQAVRISEEGSLDDDSFFILAPESSPQQPHPNQAVGGFGAAPAPPAEQQPPPAATADNREPSPPPAPAGNQYFLPPTVDNQGPLFPFPTQGEPDLPRPRLDDQGIFSTEEYVISEEGSDEELAAEDKGSERTGSMIATIDVGTVFEFYEESSEDEANAAVAVPAAASEPVTVKSDEAGASAFASVSIGFLVLSLLVAF